MTPSEAVKYVGRSEAIRTKVERQLENAWRGLRKDQNAWRRFKKAAGIANLDQVEWDQLDYTRGDFGAFVYGGRVIIDLRNSPEEIIIRRI